MNEGPELPVKGLRHIMRSAIAPLLLVSLAAACGSAPRFELVLANGRVMDPASGLDSVRHVGITAGKIAAISAEPLAGDSVIDIHGLVVAPGFIDLHAHGQTTSDMELQAQDGVTKG